MGGGYFIGAWAVHSEEVAGAAGVGNGIIEVGWGTARCWVNYRSTRSYGTSEIAERCSCPDESLDGFVAGDVAATHGVGAGCRALVPGGWVAAISAVVSGVDVETMRPTVVQIWIAFSTWGRGTAARVGSSLVVRCVVVGVVVVVVVIAVGIAAVALAGL